jgi:agarase
MFDYGLKLVRNEAERAAGYEAYMKGVLAHPQFVGAHWFRYNNHPTTGRASDGANAHNGLVDICDVPYRATIAAARVVGRNLYAMRAEGKWEE